MFKNLLFLLFFLSPWLAPAQILNIEKLRLEKDTAKNFNVKAVVGLEANNRSAGETDLSKLLKFNFDINGLFYPDKHAYIFISKVDYVRLNGEGVMNFGYVHGRANFLRENKFNYETFVQYSFDNFRGLDPRWIFGGAIRYHILRSQKSSFLIGVGGMYEFEKWRHPYAAEIHEKSLVKSSNYLAYQVAFNEHLDLNVVNYYQVGYDQSIKGFRNRISASVILNAKITDRFSLSNAFDLAFEDKPIVPITKLIYTLKTGVSFNF